MSSLLCLSAVLFVTGRALAGDDRATEGGISRTQADAILSELRQIRSLLEKQATAQAAPAPTAVVKGRLKVDGTYALGSKDAPLTMVAFSDYQCPFCRQFESTTFLELRKKYIDTGKLRFIARNLPLDFHPNAKGAAEAVLCAGDQGHFWQMHDALYSDSNKLAPADLIGYAQTLHLDLPKFKTCVETERHKTEIAKDLDDASLLQITGTPSFLLGKSTSDGVEGTVIVGAMPLAVFESKIKEVETAQ